MPSDKQGVINSTSLIVKTFLIQLIQFSISTDFVYTQLNVEIVLH